MDTRVNCAHRTVCEVLDPEGCAAGSSEGTAFSILLCPSPPPLLVVGLIVDGWASRVYDLLPSKWIVALPLLPYLIGIPQARV